MADQAGLDYAWTCAAMSAPDLFGCFKLPLSSADGQGDPYASATPSELDGPSGKVFDWPRARGSTSASSRMVPIVPGLPVGVREGEVVAGKYRIIRVLGAGAMGTVARARHLNLDQDVAIKFMSPEALGTDAVGRFVREARAAARIRSEHVVRVHDVNVLENGAPYIEMEYLDGCDLAKWLQNYGPLEVERAVDFILQACDAIAEAHDLGVIHRDIKPANLFAVQHGGVVETIKVLDFGISKSDGLVSSTLPPGEWHSGAVITQEKMPIGSPCYMSPEQMESARDVDPRTDIWAIGVTLVELLTGRLPFEGQSLVQVYARIKSEEPPYMPRRSAGAPLSGDLETAILKCLKPNREERFRSVAELVSALAPFGSSPSPAPIGWSAGSVRHPRHAATKTPPTIQDGAPETPSGAVPLSKDTLVSRTPAPLSRHPTRAAFRTVTLALWVPIAAVGVFALLRGIAVPSVAVGPPVRPTATVPLERALALPSGPSLVREEPHPVLASSDPTPASSAPPSRNHAPDPPSPSASGRPAAGPLPARGAAQPIAARAEASRPPSAAPAVATSTPADAGAIAPVTNIEEMLRQRK